MEELKLSKDYRKILIDAEVNNDATAVFKGLSDLLEELGVPGAEAVEHAQAFGKRAAEARNTNKNAGVPGKKIE